MTTRERHAAGRGCRFLLAGLCLLPPAGSALAQPPPGPTVPTWGVAGQVETLAIDGTTLYVGGTFDYVGPPTGSFGIVDAADPTAINTSAHLLTGVGAMAPDGAGGWFVSMSAFTSGPQIVHILPSGLRDPSWTSPTVDGTVWRMAQDGGRLFLAGAITAVNGVGRVGIAAIDVTTGAVLPWDARVSSFVTELAFAPGRVYLAGFFTEAGGLPRARVAVVDATTGALLPATVPDSTGPGVSGLSVADGRVYLSAFFGGGNPTVRAYDLDFVPLPTWLDAPPSLRLLATPTAVYNSVYVSPGERVEALDPLTGDPLPFVPLELRRGTDQAWTETLAVGDGRLYVGGHFTTVNGQVQPHLVAVDAVTGARTAWAPRVNGGVAAIGSDAGRVAVAGGFSSLGGIGKRNLVTIDLLTGRPTVPAAPDVEFTVRAVQRLGDVVVVGGDETVPPTTPNLLAYARTTGAFLPWSLSANGSVTALATNGRELFIGGGFTTLSGVARRGLASVDLGTATLTAWSPGLDGGVSSLAAAGSTLYTMGTFTRIDGEPHFRLAAFDTASRTLLPFAPVPGGFVDMAVHRERLLLSGTFFPPGNQPAPFRWVDRVSGAEVPPATNVAALGGRVAAAGDTVYAVISPVGLPTAPALLAIDGTSGQFTTYAPRDLPTGALAASAEYLAFAATTGVASTDIVQGFAVHRTPRAGAPRAITADVRGSTATLGWRAGVPPATTAFIVEAGTTAGADDVGTFPVGTATGVSGSLAPGTYFTRVRAIGANGPGGASSEVVLTIPPPAAPPGTPGALSASVASGIVSLAWGAAAGNATTYLVEAGTGSGLANLGTFVTGHLDTTLVTPAPPGTYVVRVRAANAFGVGAATNEVTVVVP
ncbi:MAG: hypothetical protein AB7U83_01385 [Vicinamibacterales bacterium]